MTRVFVLTNHKGGVGKSTSATNIAFGMAGLLRRAGAPNNRVLLIDTDSQRDTPHLSPPDATILAPTIASTRC